MRVWNYIFMFVTLSIFFSLAGIVVPGFSSFLSSFGLVSGSLNSSSSVYIAVLATLVGATLAGVTIGFFTKAKTENYVILPLIISGIIVFSNLAYALISAAYAYADWIGAITLIIFGPIAAGFLFAIVDYFRGGTD